MVRIGLDDTLRVYHDNLLLVTHQLRSAAEGWVQVPEHHAARWHQVLKVEQRDLSVYEEVAQWS